MSIPTVAELLQQLNVRLSHIESRSISPADDFDYRNVLKPLRANLLVLPGNDLAQTVDRMQLYIIEILAMKIKDFTVNSAPDQSPVSRTTEQTFEATTNELKYYQAALDELIARAGHNKNDANGDNVQQLVQLPDNFKIKDLQDIGFEPMLPVNEVALLLGYLRDMNYIPKLRNEDLGDIAIIFGRSKQTVRTAIGELSHRNHEDYRTARVALKTRLETIIDTIDKDLEPVVKI